MSIRYVDHSSDHRPQNPPPEVPVDSGGGGGGTRVVSTVIVDSGHTIVFRGGAAVGTAGGAGAAELSFAAPTQPMAAAAESQPADQAAPALGWVRRDPGGRYKIGAGAERTVCHFRPHWQLAPTPAPAPAAPDSGMSKTSSGPSSGDATSCSGA
jgi:hypothetical protein